MKRVHRVVAQTIVLCVTLSSLATAADPFYISRLREGIAAAERGVHGQAVEVFRIACFGLLEEEEFAECLIRLGLSQAALGDVDGFGATFRRLLEAEELLGVYSDASLDSELVSAYSRRVEELVPESIRRSTLDFGAPVESTPTEVPQQTTAPLSLKERRRSMEREERRARRDPQWPRKLALLEQESARPKAALAAAQRTLVLVPRDSVASCVAGWSEARLGRCTAALALLGDCETPSSEIRVLAAECAIEKQRWSEASLWLLPLTVAERQSPQIMALEQLISESKQAASGHVEAGRIQNEGADLEAGPTSRMDDVVQPSSGSFGDSHSPSFDLEETREKLRQATDVEDLNRLYNQTVALLDSPSGDPSIEFLAAEIAYRASRWNDAVRHFSAAGDPGDERPRLLFYLAISLYESGDIAGAKVALERCIDRLSLSPFVQRYRAAILGD